MLPLKIFRIFRKFDNWENVQKVQSTKNEMEAVINELNTNGFKDDEFKSKHIFDNQYWFTSNIREVFTPTTLKR